MQLRRSTIEWMNDKRKEYKQTIYSFGNYEKALEKMYGWRNNPELFPQELKELGYDLSDLHDWILTLETKKTKTGRDFSI